MEATMFFFFFFVSVVFLRSHTQLHLLLVMNINRMMARLVKQHLLLLFNLFAIKTLRSSVCNANLLH